MVFNTEEKLAYLAFLDQNGEFKNGFSLPNFPFATSKKDSKAAEEEVKEAEKKLENFIIESRPDLVVVGASCLEARKIRFHIIGIVEDLKKRRQEKNENTPVPKVIFWDCEVSKLVASIPR